MNSNIALIGLFASVAVLSAIERLPYVRRETLPIIRPFLASDLIYFATGYIGGGAAALAYVIALGEAVDQLGVPRLAALELPLWTSVPLALVMLDLGNYLSHFLLHRVPVLWEFHKAHHSARVLDSFATFRSHFIEQVLRRALTPLAAILVGMPVDAVAAAAAILTVWAVFNHANLNVDLRAIERVLITPRLHYIHHVSSTSNRNLGTLLTVWDRAFGRLEMVEPEPRAMLGVLDEEATYPQGWLRQFFEPLRRFAGRLQKGTGHARWMGYEAD